jgi:uncharacterized membrane protein
MALITLPPITDFLQNTWNVNHTHILGLPFFQFFMLAVPVALAIWLIIWFVWECKIDDKAEAAEQKEQSEKGGAANE